MIKLHEEWFRRAEDDLKFAEVGLKEGFYAQVCFLSQQAVEKGLKGALLAQNRLYPKIHSLKKLMKLIPELPLSEFQNDIFILDQYYLPVRYPDFVPGTKPSGPPNRDEAKHAMTVAQKILKAILKFTKTLS